MTHVGDLRTSSASVIAPVICLVCREPMERNFFVLSEAHEQCLQCPQCGDDFVVYRVKISRPDVPVTLRCMNCLHRWEGKI